MPACETSRRIQLPIVRMNTRPTLLQYFLVLLKIEKQILGLSIGIP